MTETRDDQAWFESFRAGTEYTDLKKRPVAYFCAEYALAAALPTYAGGLGVLSGDYIREAHAQGIPLLAVGLRYEHAQSMLVPETQSAREAAAEHALSPLNDANGNRVTVSIPLGERTVSVVAWEWQHNGPVVYLLDTNVPENDPRDRTITHDLYVEAREERLRQELVLGIGGYELLKKLGHVHLMYHLNEGHSAFLALAMIRHEIDRQKVDFNTAHEYARKHLLFTNHTLVLAGQEMFEPALVRAQLGRYVTDMGASIDDVVALGTTEGSSMFSMTTLAFRLSSRANAVSALHAQYGLAAWPDHPMETVTNGIYVPRWDKVGESGEAKLWDVHQKNKAKLLGVIYEATGERWDENTLLLGWARRFVEYKQPLSLLQDVAAFKAMAENSERPVRVVFAGPTGADPNSNELIKELTRIIDSSLQGFAVFLPNYNTALSEIMVAGCDVWMATSQVGREACGTSGMKAALNGSLPLASRDGWVAEADLTDCGWVIDGPDIASQLLPVIREKVVPAYYAHVAQPENSEWARRMTNSRKLILGQFSMTRALRDYVEKFYLPTLHQTHPDVDPVR